MEKRAIVFAPHPDDETLACGGIIAKRLSEGFDIILVFITDGRNALSRLFKIYSDPTPLELKKIRKDEAKRAAKILGVREEKLIFLDIEDGELKNNEGIAQKKVFRIFDKFSPVEAYFPQGKEANPDHCITNLIIKNVISNLDFHPIEYQYTIAWSFPLSIFARTGHPPFFLFSYYTRMSLISVDISKFLFRKRLALKEYKSQIKILSSRQKNPILKNSQLQRFQKNEEKFFVSKNFFKDYS